MRAETIERTIDELEKYASGNAHAASVIDPQYKEFSLRPLPISFLVSTDYFLFIM